MDDKMDIIKKSTMKGGSLKLCYNTSSIHIKKTKCKCKISTKIGRTFHIAWIGTFTLVGSTKLYNIRIEFIVHLTPIFEVICINYIHIRWDVHGIVWVGILKYSMLLTPKLPKRPKDVWEEKKFKTANLLFIV